jgi:hypothetical protein
MLLVCEIIENYITCNEWADFSPNLLLKYSNITMCSVTRNAVSNPLGIICIL